MHKIVVNLYLHAPDAEVEKALEPIAFLKEAAKKFSVHKGMAHVVYHGELDDEKTKALQSYLRTLPSLIPFGKLVFESDKQEPTKFDWSDVFSGHEACLESMEESFSGFLSEAHHLFFGK